VIGWHKAHFEALAMVLGAVQRGAKIETHISNLERNRANLVAEANRVARVVEDLPTDLLGSPAQRWLLSLSSPLLAGDQNTRLAFNAFVEAYQDAAELAATVAKDVYSQARGIELDTPARLAELKQAIDAMPIRNDFDKILQKEYHKQVDWVALRMKDVYSARAAVERAMRKAENAVSQARATPRLVAPRQ
jgi:hypothetical protein